MDRTYVGVERTSGAPEPRFEASAPRSRRIERRPSGTAAREPWIEGPIGRGEPPSGARVARSATSGPRAPRFVGTGSRFERTRDARRAWTSSAEEKPVDDEGIAAEPVTLLVSLVRHAPSDETSRSSLGPGAAPSHRGARRASWCVVCHGERTRGDCRHKRRRRDSHERRERECERYLHQTVCGFMSATAGVMEPAVVQT